MTTETARPCEEDGRKEAPLQGADREGYLMMDVVQLPTGGRVVSLSFAERVALEAVTALCREFSALLRPRTGPTSTPTPQTALFPEVHPGERT